jgi:hypothetical protein
LYINITEQWPLCIKTNFVLRFWNTFCVCAIDHDIKLITTGVKLKYLTSDMNLELDVSTHSHCLALIICNPPTEECFINGCAACPGKGLVQRTLQEVSDSNIIDVVTYKQWVTTDRCILVCK